MKFIRTVVAMAMALAAGAAIMASQMAMAQQSTVGAGYLGQSRSEYSIFVFGDSLAAGLWAGSRRVAKQKPRLRIKGRFKEGSGLARPKFHDWAKALPKIIERNPMDIAVVLIGSNDRQAVRRVGRDLEFGSEEWSQYYARRVDQVVRVLKSNKIAVYWIELPPMASTEYDGAAKRIAQIQRERVTAAAMRFVEIRKAFSNEDGTYTDRGFDVDGRFRRLRARDGIKFLKSGNTKLAKFVVDVIERDIEVADGLRTPEPLPGVALGYGSSESKPLFGHALNSGEAFTLSPSELPKVGAVTIARAATRRAGISSEALTSEAVIEALRSTAVPGSPAAQLFKDGEWPEAPSGRVDDFSLTHQ